MGNKREIGEAVLKMYFVAMTEKIPDVDVHSIFELYTNNWATKGVEWCRQRNYLSDSGITKRGLRYIRGKVKEEDYPELRDTMIRILNEESEKAKEKSE